MRVLTFLLLVLVARPCLAQLTPRPGSGDARIQVVMYDPNQVVQLQVGTGYQLTIEFAPDERIENVAVGDSGSWQLTPNKRGDHLFVKPLDANSNTNLTVITDARTYVFELTAGSSPAYTVRFLYPQPTALVAEGGKVVGRFALRGSSDILPDAMHDDGEKTYISWRPEQPIPAVFILDDRGQETLVNGAMREGHYEVDAIADKFTFRLDGRTATARRTPKVKR